MADVMLESYTVNEKRRILLHGNVYIVYTINNITKARAAMITRAKAESFKTLQKADSFFE